MDAEHVSPFTYRSRALTITVTCVARLLPFTCSYISIYMVLARVSKLVAE